MGLATSDLGKAGSASQVSPRKYIHVTDKDLCTGCRNCELICSLHHEGASSSSRARIRVAKDLFEGDYRPQTCVQCEKAKCLEACPVDGALTVEEKTNAKVINPEVCTGCRACEEACIFSERGTRIKYDARKNICLKCDLCDGDPQCVSACPESILAYGTPP